MKTKKLFLMAAMLLMSVCSFAQNNNTAIKLAGITWREDMYVKTWTFNQNGNITKKETGTLSRRLGGVYCTVEIVQTRIGTKWKLNGDTLRCEDIPLQISVNVKLQNAFSYSAAQKQSINAAIPALKQQIINEERQKWQSRVGKKYFYAIRRYSPKEFWLQYGGYAYDDIWLHRDLEHMTAAQKTAYDKLVAEFEVEKAKEKAKQEAEEKAKREAEEMAIKKSIVDGYVNLGLPSGTLWAACNVGATNPEDIGDYFAWGETKGYNGGKTNFSENNYFDHNEIKYSNTRLAGLHELELTDDAASVNLGPDWRMPSKMQFEELLNSNYTTTKFITLNGVSGLKISSKMAGYEGNSIFLPAAGYRDKGSLEHAGEGEYWSRTLKEDKGYSGSAWYLIFSSYSNPSMNDYRRFDGRSVRPVRLSK